MYTQKNKFLLGIYGIKSVLSFKLCTYFQLYKSQLFSFKKYLNKM